jgi:hypothetical protein
MGLSPPHPTCVDLRFGSFSLAFSHSCLLYVTGTTINLLGLARLLTLLLLSFVCIGFDTIYDTQDKRYKIRSTIYNAVTPSLCFPPIQGSQQYRLYSIADPRYRTLYTGRYSNADYLTALFDILNSSERALAKFCFRSVLFRPVRDKHTDSGVPIPTTAIHYSRVQFSISIIDQEQDQEHLNPIRNETTDSHVRFIPFLLAPSLHSSRLHSTTQ